MNTKTKKIFALILIIFFATAQAGYGLGVPIQEEQISDNAVVAAKKNNGRSRGIPRNGRVTLKKLFGGKGSIRSAFDAGVDTGSWLRDIKNEEWLAEDAVVMGSELPKPRDYENDHASRMRLRLIGMELPESLFKRDWSDILVLQNESRYPPDETMDLIHLGFMHADYHYAKNGDWEIREKIFYRRLTAYDAMLKEKGWLIITHYPGYAGDFTVRILNWLNEKNYDFTAYTNNVIPEDYPTTAWWDAMSIQKKVGVQPPYMIIARKHNGQLLTVPDKQWQKTLRKTLSYIGEKTVTTAVNNERIVANIIQGDHDATIYTAYEEEEGFIAESNAAVLLKSA